MTNSIFELIETDDTLPFDVSLNSVNYVPSHWHNSVEIIFVLSGHLEVTVGSQNYSLMEGDVLLINQCHVHEVIGLDMNIIATFLIPVSYLKEYIAGIESLNFNCYSGTAESKKRLEMSHMRQLLAEIIQLKYKRGEAYELEMQVRMLVVFTTLLKKFKAPVASGAMNEKYMERMLRIISYIDDHYKEAVSLQTLAEREYLSVPYLSKFFSENIGMNFQSYLTSIRLKNTVEDLLHQDDMSIADLAQKHGFPNAKSFYAAFKNRYHMTPNEYRWQYRPELHEKKKKPSSNYLAFNQSSALGIINNYLKRSQSNELEQVESLECISNVVDLSVADSSLRHTWKNLITIGKAKEGLHADVQQHLRYVQQYCRFRYLRFHGIFDDAMMVYQEDENGQPVYNFRFVDQLFDFLLSIGLKPFVELGFMPSALASDRSKTTFYKVSYISPPSSIDRWCKLIEVFIRHCMSRYGKTEVESWKFEFWNEPELEVFWSGSDAEYMDLYLRTYETMKSISTELHIGAPGCIITLHSGVFSRKFFEFCKERSCIPDFIPIHFYPHENLENIIETKHFEEFYKLDPYRKLLEEFQGISPNPDYLKDMLNEELRRMDEQDLSCREVYLTEWNSTAYHRELTNDTLYKAAYIVKNIVENLDRIDGFGYWVLSDNIEETAASAQLFHGGLGLIAQYGIPKSAMYAYHLLAKLGNRLITQGDGYIVTAGEGAYQILMYNYCHFDDLYALGDTSFINERSRYNGFKDEKTLKFTLELKDLPNGKYKVITHTISRQHGSSYDKWVEMGAPDSLTKEDVDYLKENSHPRRHVQFLDIEGGRTFVSTLEPHGVELIELLLVYE
ncbi:GH39 family glycosyl hydrolase [Paenibacillus marinisediminis]